MKRSLVFFPVVITSCDESIIQLLFKKDFSFDGKTYTSDRILLRKFNIDNTKDKQYTIPQRIGGAYGLATFWFGKAFAGL